jgi:diacylglycerol kinase (ATP)
LKHTASTPARTAIPRVNGSASVVEPALQTAVLIYNPLAGRRPARRERQIQRAAQLLREHGYDLQVLQTSGPGSATELAARSAARGIDLTVVCGGDGTINEAVNGLAGASTPLAILPGGTANIFAREIGLPLDPVRAARALPRWKPRRIALGFASADHWLGEAPVRRQRYFLSVCGVGFDSYVVLKLSSRFKLAAGVVAYAVEALRQALRYGFPAFDCRAAEGNVRATFAVVQRTRRYAGWLHLSPLARIDQPQLHLCAFKSSNRFRYFLYALAVALRKDLGDMARLTTQHVACDPVGGEEPIYFELDGELAGMLPARFSLAPDALTVLAPQPDDSEKSSAQGKNDQVV